ncbi:MAG: hypothetical protein AB7N91_33215 [Candidatus Tectimicrobiota bacterium]
MASAGSEILFQVRDMQGHTYHVQLAIDAAAAAGNLAIRQEATGNTQQHTLTGIQKSQDGNTLRCTVGMATATLSMQAEQTPPQLRLQARVFVPVLDEAYTMEAAEQQRLNHWIQTLNLALLA